MVPQDAEGEVMELIYCPVCGVKVEFISNADLEDNKGWKWRHVSEQNNPLVCPECAEHLPKPDKEVGRRGYSWGT